LKQRDGQGLALSGASGASIDHYETALGSLRCFTGDPIAAAEAAIRADPGFVMAHVFKGYMYGLSTEASAMPVARACAEAAASLPANARERGHVAALTHLAAGRWHLAGQTLEDLTIEFPTDALALQAGHQIDFFTGNSRMLRDRIARALPAWDEAMPGYHAMLGMHAFGLEEMGEYDRAECSGKKAVDLEPRDGWAQHAVAHVMEMQCRQAEGISWMRQDTEAWSRDSFLQVHNWWHLALFYLSRDRGADVLALYDTRIWGLEKDYSQDQVGAVSLLARLEFAGVDVGVRWHDVAEHVARRGADTTAPFLTLQYLYALERARRPEAARLMQAIAARAEAPSHDRTAWAEVALPAAQGIAAHARGDSALAARLLGRALPRMREIGGSHAQRDFFEQIHLDALIRAGDWSAAQQVLELRRVHDPDGIPLNRQLAQVYDAAGLPAEAARARARLPA